MLPNMQQKERSGILTTLWNADPYRNQWTMMAKVYSFLRAELGKDVVQLASFLEHSCVVLGIPSLEVYLEQQGFALLENSSGRLSLIRYSEAVDGPGSGANSKTEEGGIESRKMNSMRKRSNGCGILSGRAAFLVFKETNKENIETAAAAFDEEKAPKHDSRSAQQSLAQATYPGDEEAAAGMFAEHELLQAVFARGLKLTPTYLYNDSLKKCLVQKLYSKAYEMLIGGEFPVAFGAKGFSRTVKHNPIAAAAQLFSRDKAFDFDVLVVNSADQLQHHVFCQVDPDGNDKTHVLDSPGRLTAEALAVVGSFDAGAESGRPAGGSQSSEDQTQQGRAGSALGAANSTPTYTQHMNYQTTTHGGQFHVFSSKPSTLGHSIVQDIAPHMNIASHTDVPESLNSLHDGGGSMETPVGSFASSVSEIFVAEGLTDNFVGSFKETNESESDVHSPELVWIHEIASTCGNDDNDGLDIMDSIDTLSEADTVAAVGTSANFWACDSRPSFTDTDGKLDRLDKLGKLGIVDDDALAGARHTHGTTAGVFHHTHTYHAQHSNLGKRSRDDNPSCSLSPPAKRQHVDTSFIGMADNGSHGILSACESMPHQHHQNYQQHQPTLCEQYPALHFNGDVTSSTSSGVYGGTAGYGLSTDGLHLQSHHLGGKNDSQFFASSSGVVEDMVGIPQADSIDDLLDFTGDGCIDNGMDNVGFMWSGN